MMLNANATALTVPSSRPLFVDDEAEAEDDEGDDMEDEDDDNGSDLEVT
jgi:hypothetical protein